MSTFAEHKSKILAMPRVPQTSASSTVDAIVLGGHHWRRSLLEVVVPRPLLPVAQRPLLSYALQWLSEADVHSTTVCTNDLSKVVTQQLSLQTSFLNIDYREDGAQRGPAGCARDALAQTHSDQILVVEGSVIPVVDTGRLLDRHAQSGAAVTIVVQPPGRTSPATAPVPTGIYVFERSALELVPASGFQDIKETLIPALYRAGALIVTHDADAPCPRVLDATTYLRVNRWMIRRIAKRTTHRAPFEPIDPHPAGPEVVAHPSARIDSAASLIGPVLVGQGVTIAADATIIGPTSIGQGTTIRQGALVSRSVLWDRCTVEPRATLDGAVVMHGGTVGTGECVAQIVQAPARASEFWTSLRS